MSKEIFISYANADLKLAKKLCKHLEEEGKTCWIAPRDIVPGKEYGEEIIRGIEESKVFVIIYSDDSNHSQHVLREVERAVSKKIPIIAYKISNVQLTKSMEYFLLANQWLDATGNDDKIRELCTSVDKLLSEETPESINEAIVSKKPSILIKIARNKIAIILSVIAIGIIAIACNLHSLVNFIQKGSNSSYTSAAALKSVRSISSSSAKKLSSSSNTVSVSNNASGYSLSDSSSSSQSSVKAGNISLIANGNYIKFGRYFASGYTSSNNDSNISWIVLNYDKTSGNALMISEKILDIKPFDVAESGKYGIDKSGNEYDSDDLSSYSAAKMTEFKGNSDWEYSNIRAWLNSDRSVVTYSGHSPVSAGDDDIQNGYDRQRGFLYDFTSKEKSMLMQRNNVTTVNSLKQGKISGSRLFAFMHNSISASWNFSGVMSKTTTDKVFLLSIDEVKTFMYNEKIGIFTQPTLSAINSDKSSWYRAYKGAGMSNYIWALRTPEGTKSYSICVVGTGDNQSYEILSKNAAAAGLGIRPAMVINLKNVTLQGEGSRLNPFTIA